MGMNWSPEALALFAARAIDPAVAAAAGVREEGGALVYPTGKRRSLNGNGPQHLHPEGEPVRPLLLNRADHIPVVLIAEGETDALAAASALHGAPGPFPSDLPVLGLPGCSFPADTLTRGLAEKYRTRDAFLALDPDEAGQRALAKFRAALEARGIRAIPVEIPDGFDLASWCATVDGPGFDLPSLLADAEAAYTRQRQGVSFAEVAPEPVRWLWRHRVPRGNITVCAADPGMGKSTWTCVLAAELSREGASVLMANAEDPPPRTRERLEASGADLGRVRPVSGLVLPDHTEQLAAQAAEVDADLITIDPYNAYLADGINALRDQQVRHALAPLARIAKELECAVVIVCHLNRGGEEESAIYRIPVGLRGIARSVLMMQVDTSGTHLIHRKSSYGPLQESMLYRFEGGRLVEAGSKVAKTPPEVATVERDGSTEVRDYTQTDALGVAGFDE